MANTGYDRLESRRKRERLRKRNERKRRTPEQRKQERLRKLEARRRQRPEQLEREKARGRRRRQMNVRPFMAIDGEGGGSDELGRQSYLLMVASGMTVGEERVLHRDGMPLRVTDWLEFILSLPTDQFSSAMSSD